MFALHKGLHQKFGEIHYLKYVYDSFIPAPSPSYLNFPISPTQYYVTSYLLGIKCYLKWSLCLDPSLPPILIELKIANLPELLMLSLTGISVYPISQYMYIIKMVLQLCQNI